METPSYRGFRFPPEVISHCVWLYHRFSLSLRDVEELMLERGIEVSHETVHQWTRRFGRRCQVEWVLGDVFRFGMCLAAVVAVSQAVVGRPTVPVICFQIAKRMIISVRYSVPVIRWRRGLKWGEMPLNAARNRWAAPIERKPFMARSRCLVGW